MSKKQLVIQHDLSKLDAATLAQYLRDVSEFIGLDPDLNALDTIWMQNENGPGQSLVVYARRGTAEILRNKLGIEVESLVQTTVSGSIIFTATGRLAGTDGGLLNGRQEIAVGSKYITGLTGKALDDAIMTASTRALRRLTMQFTTLGLLDESEVKLTVGDTTNPAAGAALAGSPMVIPPFPTVANNAPGKDVTTVPAPPATPVIINGTDPTLPPLPRYYADPSINPLTPKVPSMQEMREEATRQLTERSAKTSAKADIKPDIPTSAAPVTPAVAPVTTETEADIKSAKPKRARKPKNSVSLESGPEPETVTGHVSVALPTAAQAVLSDPQATPAQQAAAHATAIVTPTAAPVATFEQAAASAARVADGPVAPSTAFPGQPSTEQMADYRKRVSVYTSQLPSSENLGSVQKMRGFITKMSGTAPQFMTVDQWEETLGWFAEFTERNQIKGLVGYINDILGVK